MEIYLVRHTTPLVETGTCYGQSDLDVAESFEAEAKAIDGFIPTHIQTIYTSPLQRCKKLADRLFVQQEKIIHPHLMELDCGQWEMRKWDDIPRSETEPWMQNFVHVKVPGGESYIDLHQRCVALFENKLIHEAPLAVVTHAGVIRSTLSHITNTALEDSFKVFKIYYGCVIKLYFEKDAWQYEILHNVAPTHTEWHRPSYS